NCHPRGLLHHRVQIDERPPQPRRQPAAHGGLARSHEADENHIADHSREVLRAGADSCARDKNRNGELPFGGARDLPSAGGYRDLRGAPTRSLGPKRFGRTVHFAPRGSCTASSSGPPRSVTQPSPWMTRSWAWRSV